ncbi:Ppx/GppA phosphatase family protein [Rhodococcus aerolatus]
MRVAAVDCGTNSVRLLVAEVDASGPLRDLHREMRVVRLGQGVDATGELAPEAVERTRLALVDYAATIAGLGAERVRMVATSASRDARNRDDFVAVVRETLGVDPEVITGDEEARASFAGAVGDLDAADGPFVVVDLGGGSTEVVTGGADGVTGAFSADVGCVRLTERCLPDDPPTAAQVATARGVAEAELGRALAAVDVSGARTWVGVAGTMTTIAALALGLETYDPDRIHLARVPLDRVLAVCDELVAMPRTARAALGPMHPGRVDVIGGGAVVTAVLCRALAERAGITDLVVSEHDILDGIALGLR